MIAIATSLVSDPEFQHSMRISCFIQAIMIMKINDKCSPDRQLDLQNLSCCSSRRDLNNTNAWRA